MTLANTEITLGEYCLRRWSIINPSLAQRLFAGNGFFYVIFRGRYFVVGFEVVSTTSIFLPRSQQFAFRRIYRPFC